MKKISGDFFTSQGPPKPEQIVQISDLQRIRQRLDLNIERKKGNIILIIGTRGIGKSTSLEYCREHVNASILYDCSRFFNAGLYIPQLLEKEYHERVPYILKETALILSDHKTDDINCVINTLNADKKGPYFLFIDNLDRLYQSKDDLSFVKYFFQTADPILKELSKKVVIVISCAPEWIVFLGERDLSYLNFSNSITLEPLPDDEIRKLIESRAIAEGLKIGDIIKEELVPVLRVASRGNPRSVFQFLEKVLNKIDESKLPIDVPTFQKVVGSELFGGIIEKLKEISSKSPKICWGINQMWRYFDILQKSGIDYVIGIEKLIELHEKGIVDEPEIKPLKSAWSRISHKSESGKWILNTQVRDMITQWYRETKINKEILLTAFSENPFTVSTTDVEDYVDYYRTSTIDIESASLAFDSSFEEYMSIISINDLEDRDRINLINSGWNCLKQLMLTIIAIEEGDVPKELSSRLDDEKTFEEAASELIGNVGAIYKEFNKVNPFRSELLSIKERYTDIKINPEVVRYWDTEQMKEFRRQVLNSYEGLLRGLKPSTLEASNKRIQSHRIYLMIVNGEDYYTEFKSSLRWNHIERKINEDYKKAILKTIVAFLNSDGGNLIIGVNDRKEVLGIEEDIATLKKGIDGYEQYIMNLVDSYIGSDVSVYLKTSFPRFKGYRIAIISVEKSPYHVYLKDNLTSEFYIRSGNTKRKLDGNELEKYIQTHWISRK